MTGEQLRQLETDLWKTADQLRANSKLTATEYSMPVLGLIFLRHAYNRYKSAKAIIEQNLPVHPQRGRRALTKDDFVQAKALFLPEQAQWEYLSNLEESKDPGEALDEAMKLIEDEYEVLNGVLPKNYKIFEKDLLFEMIRIFNTERLNDVKGDVFGKIYEYFLNKFAMSGAQEGGEFFTPPSLVNTIVNIIEPDHGTVFDPACGSAGMFVQTGHFIEEEGFDPANKVTFYGQEKADTNTRLAKMNMAVHGLDASILQGNTFYEDKHDLVGGCDFVMANPPFNVDGVDKSKETVKKDSRLGFGLPKNDNANYLWIQYFYNYLKPTGRAGFVMASSASDAGHSEKLIREKIVEAGAVDVMVAIGTKFFYTRSLPCTLWFYDRTKENDDLRSDQTLMLDAREVYRKVSSNLHDFTEEQLRNIKAIVSLYRGSDKEFLKAAGDYLLEVKNNLRPLKDSAESLLNKAGALKQKVSAKLTEEQRKGVDKALDKWEAETRAVEELIAQTDKMEKGLDAIPESAAGMNELQQALGSEMKTLRQHRRQAEHLYKQLENAIKEVVKAFALNKEKEWKKLEANAALKELEVCKQKLSELEHHIHYFHKEAHWLLSRFPEGKYADVAGLCKIVSREEIAANDYSLTPGRYVGVAPQVEDEDFDFEERMGEIKTELLSLNEEAVALAGQIQEDLNELGV